MISEAFSNLDDSVNLRLYIFVYYTYTQPPFTPPDDGTTTPSMPRAPGPSPRPLTPPPFSPAHRRLGARARGGSRPRGLGERSGGWEVRGEGGVARLCVALRLQKAVRPSVRPSLLGASLRSPPPPQGAAGSSLACCRLPAVSPAPAATQPASARPYGRREPLGACPQPRFVLRAAGCNLLGLFVLFVLLFFLSLFNFFFFSASPLPPFPPLVPLCRSLGFPCGFVSSPLAVSERIAVSL